MLTWSTLIRTPFSFLFVRTRLEERMVEYVVREHRNGRVLEAILADPYVRNRLGAEQRARLLDHPELVHAVADDLVRAGRKAA